MSSEYQPFAWLNTDKLLNDEIHYFSDLGLLEYFPAICLPLESAVKALLDEERDRVNITPSSLPRLTREVLNDPARMIGLIRSVAGSGAPDISLADASDKMMTKLSDIEPLKVAVKNKRPPEFNLFSTCGYCIDGVDLQALLIIQQFDDFYLLHCTGAESYLKLLDFGLLFSNYGLLQATLKKGYLDALAEHIQNVQRNAKAILGGEATKEKSLKELKILRQLALEEIQKDYDEAKRQRNPVRFRKEKVSDEFIRWDSVDHAATETLRGMKETLRLSPITAGKKEGAASKNSVGITTYTKIIKSLSEEYPQFFR